MTHRSAATTVGLSAQGLGLQRGGTTILADITLSLPATGSVALIGPNGAGKSTLLRALAGLLVPDHGTVRLGDRPVAALPTAERAATIGFLPQHFAPHWDLRVVDLVRLGVERGGTASPDAAATDSVAAVLAAHGLGPLAQRRWSALSGGERARVLLAMVLAVDPPVLIADEPGASLDVRHRIGVVDGLARRGRDRLCIVAMHDLDLAFRAFDRVVLLAGGRLAAAGTAADLFHDRRLDRAFGVDFMRLETPHGRLLQAVARPDDADIGSGRN
ncbi:ATP-binding cassette domain-containing protein [Rhodoplanes serenus]|uniref:ATP-binding cassette domain-containing protein n=1 Tax=Rhodoplanes serenus TaxID=200615 RepID=A0A9X5AU17_9BRAD|nr:ABC transporter ATP-binding protein [Rhodoplanes serenus]MTW17870.1 ATP-binding cassette domain-containing protein [Rhodoplanes serenus]